MKKKMYVFFIFIVILYNLHGDNEIQTIALIPGGVKSLDDRALNDFYQYGITQKMCESIANKITEYAQKHNLKKNVIIVRTKHPNDKLFFQAEQVNKINPYIAVYVGAYIQPSEIPHIEIYTYQNLAKNELCTAHDHEQTHLVSVHHAHCKNFKKSSLFREKFYHFFTSDEKQNQYKTQQFSLPFMPLKGIVCPSFGFELGITKYFEWSNHVTDISEAIIALLKSDFQGQV